jgi:hypothetical protein
MVLVSTLDRRRFFVVPDLAALGDGALEVQTPTGERVRVDAEAAARHEVPETAMRVWAELDRVSVAARQQLDGLLATAGLGRAEALLAAAGIEGGASADVIARQLSAFVRQMGIGDAGPPAAAAAAPSAAAAPMPDLGAMFQRLGADPDADPELREAAAALEALARSLDEPR